MTKYKVIDGVAYKVEELNVEELKQEVDKAVLEIETVEKEKAQHEANIKNMSSQFDAQVEAYEKQIANLAALVETVKEKKASVIAPHEALVKECDEKLVCLKDALVDKKEIIESLLPEESKKLGL